MKHREHLIKAVKKEILGWVLGALLAFFVIEVLLFITESKIIAIPIGGILFALIYTSAAQKVKCLVCGYIYDEVPGWRIKYGTSRKRINYCPHCGESLDGEVN
ncbi:MAG: hypothetical protein L0G80_18935 [Shewanella sp.]|uniref:hypothetical protein n=1 Tax=Shewanella sp. TaxID=50422 RepID=UPI002649777D|nr:hypothetical protein [Shewanella sp.]MDN5501981.1 hypothetical protein [Shewanella sp.]MDN5529979.1 hypothetical protein [Shewanella sp.]